MSLAWKLLTLCFLMSSFASAQMGPSNGGGGDIVILPNDDVVLADPFLDHGGPQPNNMPPMRSLNPRILQAITAYAKVSKRTLEGLSIKESDIAKLMGVLAQRKNDLRFYAVQNAQELSTFCAPGGKKSYVLPNGATVQNVACTAGNETFMVEPLFLRLSIRDQALLLIHERLTTLRDNNGGKNYSAIARFTTGLRSFLEIAREQGLRKYRLLTPEEVNGVTEFYIAAEEIEKRDTDVTEDSFMSRAHVYGGGRVHAEADVSPEALVDIRSLVAKRSVVSKGVKLLDVQLAAESLVGEHAIIMDVPSNIQVRMGPGSTLKGIRYASAPVDGRVTFDLAEAAQVTDSTLNCTSKEGCKIVLGARSAIIGSQLEGIYNTTLGSSVLVRGSRLGIGALDIGSDSRIEESQFDLQGARIGDNSVIQNTKIVMGRLNANDGLVLVNSHIDLLIPGKGYYGREERTDLNLKFNSKMENGSLSASSLDYAPATYRLKEINVTVPVRGMKAIYENGPEVGLEKQRTSITAGSAQFDFSCRLKYGKKGVFGDTYVGEFSDCKIQAVVKNIATTRGSRMYTVFKGELLEAGPQYIFDVEPLEKVGFFTSGDFMRLFASPFRSLLANNGIDLGSNVVDNKVKMTLPLEKR